MMSFDKIEERVGEIIQEVALLSEELKGLRLESAKNIADFKQAKDEAQKHMTEERKKAEIAFQENIEFNLMQEMRGLFEEHGFTNTAMAKIINAEEKETENKSSLRRWAGLFGAAIFFNILSIILVWFIVEYHHQENMSVLAKQLDDAVLIERAWPNLSKAEQTKIIDLAAGKAPVAEKSVHNTKK